MKSKTYCPVMDGIPGLFSGTMTLVPKPDDETIPMEHPQNVGNLRDNYDCSNAVKTMNRRMMQKGVFVAKD